MFISIPKIHNRYAFIVGDNPADDALSCFGSLDDFFLVKGLPSSYESFGEAHAFAMRLIDKVPSAIFAKKAVYYKRLAKEEEPEEITIDHFYEQVALLHNRLSSILSEPDVSSELLGSFIEEAKAVKDSVKSIQDQITTKDNDKEINDILHKLNKIIEKAEEENKNVDVGQDIKEASIKKDKPAWAKDIIRAFTEAALRAVSCPHPEAYIKSIYMDNDTGGFDGIIAEGDDDIVVVKFNDNYLFTGAVPSSTIIKDTPYHSSSFYTKYLEPIVSSIGHIYIQEHDVVAMPSGKRFHMHGFVTSDCKPVSIFVSNTGTWNIQCGDNTIKTASSKFTEQDLPHAEVKCTRKDLPTYYERTGEVIKVTPRADYVDVTVDFRRGLGHVTLKDSDIEIVNLP